MSRFFTLTVLTLALACGSKPEQPLADTPELNEKKSELMKISQEAMVIDVEKANDKRPELDGHLFGKFFGDRAEFFVIQDSQSQIHGSQVKTTILYYLDEQHCQSKFVLSDNIANDLISRFGKFSISPLDLETKRLLEVGPILVTENDQTILNKALRRFELTWRFPDKTVRFRVDRNSSDEEYVYTEHIPDYDDVFRAVEKASL